MATTGVIIVAGGSGRRMQSSLPKQFMILGNEPVVARTINTFAEVLPEYDRERVHVSDIKKALSWFNILVGAGLTEFTLPEEEEEPSEE